jgi:hypothetical protein
VSVGIYASTMPGAVTPTCSDCGVALCWDISDDEYEQAIEFWDAWICQDCNGGEPRNMLRWIAERRQLAAAVQT